MKSTREEQIQMIRGMARERVERLGSHHGQRARSNKIIISAELLSDLGIQPPGFNPGRDLLAVETRYHNNHGKLIATDHSISIAHDAILAAGMDDIKWEVLSFELGEFMEAELPSRPQIDPKKFVMDLPQSKRVELYKWMHDALDCRI